MEKGGVLMNSHNILMQELSVYMQVLLRVSTNANPRRVAIANLQEKMKEYIRGDRALVRLHLLTVQ